MGSVKPLAEQKTCEEHRQTKREDRRPEQSACGQAIKP